MFPNVHGFEWSAGHVIFLGIFFGVIAVIGVTIVRAMLRSWRDMRARRVDTIRWHTDFHDLPARDRACRHAMTGEFRGRVCQTEFDCRGCKPHASLAEPAAAEDDYIAGMRYPNDRYYHRGHTWTRAERDGTVTVGLDELGTRLIGRADQVKLPTLHSRLQVNGTGWHMRRNGVDIRVLSPVEGEVVATGGAADGWYLRVKPDASAADLRHLLLERLQFAMAGGRSTVTLADGGVLMEDLPEACPKANWSGVYGAMFLEP
jgi:glycine cleavage system H lipoate-binding protein